MTENTAIVPAGPSRMSFGQTRLDAGDILMPRIKVLQAQSAEASGDEPLGKPGEIFNTLSNEVYGKVLRFVPIVPFKQRVFLVRSEKVPTINAALVAGGLEPLPEGSDGLTCRSYDMDRGNGYPGIECEACPLSKWDGDLPPLCSETYNVAAASEYGDLIVLSFSRSSAKAGRQLFSSIRLRPSAYATIFEMTTRSERGTKGTYFVPVITPKEKAPDELIRQVNAWASQLEGAVINVTPEDEEAPAAASGSDPF